MLSSSVRLSLCFTLTVFLSPAICRADSVDVGIGGHLLNESPLLAGQNITEQFTLDQNTLITSFTLGIESEILGTPLSGSWEVTVTGSGGTYVVGPSNTSGGIPAGWVTTPLPAILPADTYTLTFVGGPCGSVCFQNTVAGLDFYGPATFFNEGGSATGTVPGGGIGFEIVGVTTPETSTWTLVATALSLIFLCRFRHSKP
jgi:hypothetical protein